MTLTPRERSVLATMRANPWPWPAADIADHMRCSPAAAERSLERLARRGLVRLEAPGYVLTLEGANG